ncbi:uncharacterized protein LOC128243978 [Mya arenaria]|uniref:uncharacterized protein LOC128243978 n=1 Tax=Mya arenaria TaxID=6604 RepID=UPI0022E46650|nr:uncharacterized protein LOC128243978 [Mya arenaria]
MATKEEDKVKQKSRTIFHVLDLAGASDYVRRLRQHCTLIHDVHATVMINMKKYSSIHTFESTSEGTTTPGLNSDIDTMMCFRMFPVYENSEDAKHHMTQMRSPGNLQEGENTHHIVMLVDDHTPVGFSKLEFVKNTNLQLPFILEQDSYGKTVLDNICIVEALTGDERNGPAATILKRPGYTDIDHIPSFHCKTWPAVADEFFTRNRMFEFPGQNIRAEFGNLGIFFVPTGHGDSQEKHLQWRLSFSLQERKIMLNLNETQHKCYVLLKMTKEDFVKPNVSGKSLTSYQCKTSMFFEMENSPDSFWIPENLIYCYINCLKRLRGWIQNGFVPSYFMPDVNIWKGDMTVQNKVVKVLEDVLESPLDTLMQLRCDKVGSLLNDMVDYNLDEADVPDNDFSTDLTQADRALQLAVHALHYCFIVETVEIAGKLISENRGNVDANITHREKLIEMLNDKDSLCDQTLQSNTVVNQAVDYLVPFIYTSLGSHLIVKGIQESSDIFKNQGLGYLKRGLESGLKSFSDMEWYFKSCIKGQS